MSTITLDVSPTTARRLADDPEALRLLAAMAEEAFGGPTKLVVSNELYASFLEVIDGVEAGTIKTKPHRSCRSGA